MKRQLAKFLATEGHEVVDFGNKVYDVDDDYPDFAVALAHAVLAGDVKRGHLGCGSGVGASVAANKVNRVLGALCEEHFSARRGVDDHDLHIVCFVGRSMRSSLS